mmetsp:Transcript_9906/g.23016  ORF Transcript_9906/g.23016 Transcript_9906/m.23016 type:complete len:352 (-) Transcript_9906:82-1137(-)|eukprot:Transcript_31836.p3 GENE.Transcript_31836~~Transcript_31836.p3  ORF type:complete len:352 (-),score=124.97 Transcript_31836:103-1158(-)
MLASVLLSSTSAAFMPSASPLTCPRTRSSARLASQPVVMELDTTALVIRSAATLPAMYAMMSLNEYMTHRYFQHLEFNRPESLLWLKSIIAKVTGDPVAPKVPGDGHVEHHAETYDDMSLKNDERWRGTKVSQSLDHDEYRGTAFHWSATAIMTVQMLPSVLPTYALMGYSLPESMAILLPCMLVHAIIWNAVHPPMHGLPPVHLGDGFGTVFPGGATFSEWILESAYGRYIYENHMGHHVLGGQCNYNVCCPMTDHLLGTYVSTADWAPKMRPLPVNAQVRGPVVAPQTHGGVPQLPTREEYFAAKNRAAAVAAEQGTAPAVLANGGSMIADAYSTEEEAEAEQQQLVGA